MHVCNVVQEAVLGTGWCLPTDIASHSRSYAAILEDSYGVSWVTKGCLAASLACLDIRGCGISVAPVLVMRCNAPGLQVCSDGRSA